MQAMVYTRYGSPDVLELREVAMPAPKPDEVLIKVHAASVNAADWHLLRGEPFLIRLSEGLRQPKHQILGADVAGEVVAVGSDVTHIKPGQAVFGDLSASGFGAFAEYVAVPANQVLHKLDNISYAHAAAVPLAAVTALQALRTKARVQPGEHVAINGASGGVGTFAVQLARVLGAEVTAICSTGKVGMMQELGAHHVIDYTQQDFTSNADRYDVIIAANGYHPLRNYQRALRTGGRYVMVGGKSQQMFEAMLLGPMLSLANDKQLMGLIASPNCEDLAFVQAWLMQGQVAPVIDRTYPLDALAEAIRYVEQGSARGKVVIEVWTA